MKSSCFYDNALKRPALTTEQAKRRLKKGQPLYGPVGIPQAVRPTRYSEQVPTEAELSGRPTRIYSLDLYGQRLAVNLDAEVYDAFVLGQLRITAEEELVPC